MEEVFARPPVAPFAGPTAVARMAMTKSWPRDSDGLAWHKSALPSLPVLQDLAHTWQSSWKIEPQVGSSVSDGGSDPEEVCLLKLLDCLISEAGSVPDPLLDVACFALMKLKAASIVAEASSMQDLRLRKMELIAQAARKGFGSICYLLADRRTQLDSRRDEA
ncbi:unnamed protein product [Polarella glacialis]|uniref:Uncharacterized protein n=1 Tax=Polarella glacialis TaxID=89957 RepID=A0A813I1N0_POLGL|nr:unnamed protein product [Polarella glacialis]